MIYMVQSMINISPRANHVLEIIKARYQLKNKGDTITFIVENYGESLLEPGIRPEYEEKLKSLRGEEKKATKFNSIKELDKLINGN